MKRVDEAVLRARGDAFLAKLEAKREAKLRNIRMHDLAYAV